MARRKDEETSVTYTYGSVFHALGLPDADELIVKAKIMDAILLAVHEQKLTQKQITRLAGLDQPKVSKLLQGRLSGFSTGRLMHILACLGPQVEIRISPKARSQANPGQVSVLMAH